MKRIIWTLAILALAVTADAQTKTTLTSSVEQEKGWQYSTDQHNAANSTKLTVDEYKQARYADLGNGYYQASLAAYTGAIKGAVDASVAKGDETTLDSAAKALAVTRPSAVAAPAAPAGGGRGGPPVVPVP